MKRTDEIPHNNPFKVPEDYFQEVNRRIISDTAGTEIAPVKTGSYRRLGSFFAVAASIAAFMLISYTTVKMLFPETRNTRLPEVSLQEFSESCLYDIDLLTLEEKAESLIQSENLPDMSNSEIIEYLLLENINVNEIYELL